MLEVSDILDELNMISRVLQVQDDTILKAKKIFQDREKYTSQKEQKPSEILEETLITVKHYSEEIKTMTEDASRTYKAVSASPRIPVR